MLTEEQKRELEWLYNGYSFNKGYALKYEKEEWRAKEWTAKMMALRSAVWIFGYTFKDKKMKEEYGIEYPSYRLEEIKEE